MTYFWQRSGCHFSVWAKRAAFFFSLLLGVLHAAPGIADSSAAQFIEFDDTPLQQDIVLPDWFKLSFLELKNDLQDLDDSGHKYLLLYFGRKDCPYCKVHLEKNWGDRGITHYTQEHFDVIAIDVIGLRPVADFNGKVYKSEKEFAASKKANFTPSLLFFDRKGKEVLRLSGYHPPFQFRAALEYVADKHYLKESFRHYMLRGETPSGFEESEMNENPVFQQPPYALDRTRFKAGSHLAVFFEEPTCHPCNVLHAGPMKDKNIIEHLNRMEVIQLDMHSDTPVLTPDGKKTTAKKWAEKLNLYYAPTLIFFDPGGKEILRIDSVVRFYRLNNVLEYIESRGYERFPSFQVWRQHHNR